ncbi:MAG: DUF4292 domain-containing protein [Planctomycetes bacterium]|nr:DUF4292 domain-containing protein [Planctomycetota bacterium]MBL7145115.1 DUF4292 domain-containing protein [Phycisphaerae bacterium]
MNEQHYYLRLCFCFAVGVLFFNGCAIEPPKPPEMMPGKESATEALAVLKARSQNAVSLLARGRCVFEYYDPENKKRKKEKLEVTVLMKPPVELYLQGDATLVPKAIILGSNEREFWLVMRPNEISTYWWGTWSEQNSSQGLIINPRTLFEALGFLETGAEGNWSLSNKATYDVLIQRNKGVVVKKMRINRRDYLISTIEYYDSKSRALALAELKDYKEVSDGFFVPASIKIIAYDQDNIAEPLGITLNLKSIKPKEFTERQQKVFERPPPGNLRHILKNEGEKWIEQSQ